MGASIAFLSREWLVYECKIMTKISLYLLYVYNRRSIKKSRSIFHGKRSNLFSTETTTENNCSSEI